MGSSRWLGYSARALVVGIFMLEAAACGGGDKATPTATKGPAVTPTATKPALPTAAPTSAPTAVSTPGSGPTATTAVSTASPVPTVTSTPKPTTAPAIKPKAGGSITTTYNAPAPTFDVIKQSTFATHGPVAAIYSRLVRPVLTPETEFGSVAMGPDIAESWTVTSDGLNYTFKLRKGVKWQNIAPVNGRELKASDILFTVNLIKDPATGSPNKSIVDSIDTITAPDDYTVVMKLKQPNAEFIEDMGSHYARIVAKEVWDQDKEFGKTLVGSGPWIMKDAKRDIGFTAVRNPNYYFSPLPYLDGWQWLIIPDANAQMAALRAQRIDVGWYSTGPKPRDIEALKKDLPAWKTHVGYRANLGGLMFNTQKEPWNNLKVRQAVNLAIDRRRNLTLVSGLPESAGMWRLEGFIPTAIPGYGMTPNEIEQLFGKPDVAKAKQLLQEAGYAPGSIKTSIIYHSAGAQDDAPILQSMLKDIGIEATLSMIDRTAWYESMEKSKNYSLSAGIFTTSFGVNFWMNEVYSSTGGRNYFNYKNPEFDKVALSQRTMLDTALRQKTVRDAQNNILAKDIPFIIKGWTAQTMMSAPWMRDYNPHWSYGLPEFEIAWMSK